jgi:hypothetical protein
MNFDWGNLQGIIPIVGGIYGYLMAVGTVPRNPRDPEKMAEWREKFGRALKIFCPILVLLGVLELLGVT